MFTKAIENQVKTINQTSERVKVRVSGPSSIRYNADCEDEDVFTLYVVDDNDNEFTVLENLTLDEISEILETVQAFADLCG